MNVIQHWLNNDGTYKDGLKLYANYPKHNKNLLRVFKKRKSLANLVKLKYELTKASKVTITPKKVTVKHVDTTPTPAAIVHKAIQLKEAKQKLFFHQLPEPLQPVLLEANILFKTACFLKVKLNALEPKAVKQANTIQLDIEECRNKNAHCWKQIDYWLEHKRLPIAEPCELEGLSPTLLLRKEQNLFSAISRLKKRIEANKTKRNKTTDRAILNTCDRAIAKAEANVINKETQLLKVKDLINGKR